MATTPQVLRSPSTFSPPIPHTPSVLRKSTTATSQKPQSKVSVARSEPSLFENTTIQFPDQSRWLIQTPMSRLQLLRSYSPAEARQLFSAVCVKDPSGKYRKGTEAVIRIAYQMHSSEETIDYYQEFIDEYEKDDTSTSDIQKKLKHVRECLDLCSKPAELPRKCTVNEMSCLMKLAEHRCTSAPWLLDFVKMPVPSGLHRKALVGGYLAFMLINKISAVPLSSGFLKGLTPAEREHVREDFKKAILEIRKCGIVSDRSNLKNLMWDKDKRICYIMGFEDASVPTAEQRESQDFNDNEYVYWGLAEDNYK